VTHSGHDGIALTYDLIDDALVCHYRRIFTSKHPDLWLVEHGCERTSDRDEQVLGIGKAVRHEPDDQTWRLDIEAQLVVVYGYADL
jgi:hypothetical protein